MPQDCVAFMPPHPFETQHPSDGDFDLGTALTEGKVWFGTVRLLFRCNFKPKPDSDRDSDGESEPVEEVPLDLALITTFEDFGDTDGLAERQGCKILYEPRPTPCVYIVPVSHILCRVPLAPCFLHGNTVNTVPSSWPRNHVDKAAGLRKDTRPNDGNGSYLYQINMWLWEFGRPVPRTIGVPMAVRLRALAEDKRQVAVKTAKELAKRRKAAQDEDRL
jgi:hypothetical protein